MRGQHYDKKIVPTSKRKLVSKSVEYKRVASIAAAIVVCLVLVGSLSLGLQIVRAALGVPNVELPTLAQSKAGVTIFDRHDKLVCTVHADCDKEPIPLSQVSPYMRNALLAAEDHTFYHHHGLDPFGIVRATAVNWRSGRTVQGASTITQQLARNLFLNKDDKSFTRKIREAFIAWDLENKYSKSKIMESYLNEVYFGGGVHGVERAAQHYFCKHASQLSLSESAFMAGLIRQPTMLGAVANRDIALARRDQIIDQMLHYGLITGAQASQSRRIQLAFKEGPNSLRYPQYISYVMQELDKMTDSHLRTQGCKVYTSLDPQAQYMAVKELNQGIKHAPKGIDQGALVTISLKDGAILAMVGGVGNKNNEWNRATHPHTAGSSFKPFVYLTALIKGVVQQDSIVDDAPCSIESAGCPPYAPHNFDGCYKGWMTCRDALAHSRNVCAVRVAQASGMDSVVETAHAAGVKAQLDPYPSLALGSCAVSPLDMANAYATLARYGGYMPASTIRRIETSDGKLVQEFNPSRSQNLPAEQVAELVDVMQDVVRRGTGVQARLPGISVAGKTGTADKGKDLWFVGFTPDTVTAVWGGNDKNSPVRGSNVTGGAVMAHIWNRFMTGFYTVNKAPVVAFAPPAAPLTSECPPYLSQTLAANPVINSGISSEASSAMQLGVMRGIVSLGELQQAFIAQRNQQIAQSQAEQEMLMAQQQQQAENTPDAVSSTVSYDAGGYRAGDNGTSATTQWQGSRSISSTSNPAPVY